MIDHVFGIDNNILWDIIMLATQYYILTILRIDINNVLMGV